MGAKNESKDLTQVSTEITPTQLTLYKCFWVPLSCLVPEEAWGGCCIPWNRSIGCCDLPVRW